MDDKNQQPLEYAVVDTSKKQTKKQKVCSYTCTSVHVL